MTVNEGAWMGRSRKYTPPDRDENPDGYESYTAGYEDGVENMWNPDRRDDDWYVMGFQQGNYYSDWS